MSLSFADLLLPLCLFAVPPQGDGYLGVEVTDHGGPRVVRVIEGSPAARADIRVDDVFLVVGDEETPDVESFVAAVGRHDAGDLVHFVLRRGEAKLEKNIRLGRRRGVRAGQETEKKAGQKAKETKERTGGRARPKAVPRPERPQSRPERRGGLVLRRSKVEAPEAGTRGRAFLGVAVEQSEEGGVRVVDVLPDGPASGVLRKGDILLRLGDEEIEDLDDVEEALAELRPGQGIPIVLRRGGKERTVGLTLGARPEEGKAAAPAKVRPAPRLPGLTPRPLRPLPAPRRGERARAPAGDLSELRAEMRRLRQEISQLRALVRKLLEQQGRQRR